MLKWNIWILSSSAQTSLEHFIFCSTSLVVMTFDVISSSPGVISVKSFRLLREDCSYEYSDFMVFIRISAGLNCALIFEYCELSPAFGEVKFLPEDLNLW